MTRMNNMNGRISEERRTFFDQLPNGSPPTSNPIGAMSSLGYITNNGKNCGKKNNLVVNPNMMEAMEDDTPDGSY